jgi:putative tryptophan/tyrosine transport system substrate-binding protein
MVPFAQAQQSNPVIGYLHAGSAAASGHQVKAFAEGLAQLGYADGQNVSIEYRWAESRYERLPSLAAELVQRHVALIAVGTPVATLAVKKLTESIPIVFHIGSDPVENRIVESLGRPGGNITGATFFSNLLTAKRLGLLHELVPKSKTFGVLLNPKNPNARMQSDEAEHAARTLNLQLIFVNASTEGEIDKSFDTFKQQQVQALLILSDAFLNNTAARIANQAVRHGLPTCFALRQPAIAGGLMSYGASTSDAARQAGIYTARILKGEKPADLPDQQPTKFEFIINMKTAKALGFAVPHSMQLLADEVIE